MSFVVVVSCCIVVDDTHNPLFPLKGVRASVSASVSKCEWLFSIIS